MFTQQTLKLLVISALFALPFTATADDHMNKAAADAHMAADAAGKSANDMAAKAAACHKGCANEKDMAACTAKCNAEMQAGQAETMKHANEAMQHGKEMGNHAAAAAAAAGAPPAKH